MSADVFSEIKVNTLNSHWNLEAKLLSFRGQVGQLQYPAAKDMCYQSAQCKPVLPVISKMKRLNNLLLKSESLISLFSLVFSVLFVLQLIKVEGNRIN